MGQHTVRPDWTRVGWHSAHLYWELLKSRPSPCHDSTRQPPLEFRRERCNIHASRYDVVEEEFELWSYEEEEEAATLTAMEESVNSKIRVLRNLTTSQYAFRDKLPYGITLGHIV
ncbi:hypothetical protein HAV15_012232 [Penicillium sp. str. |nr:hypothetical protein HAV15_012232 [Penicillium sp. str. \